MFGRKKCVSSADGIIVKHKRGGADSPGIIWVEYNVNGVVYQKKETVKLKSEKIKAGPVVIGQKKTPRLPKLSVGTSVVVRYNPDKPSKAYIEGNDGFINN